MSLVFTYPKFFGSFSKDSLLGTLYLSLRFIHSYTYFFQNQISYYFQKKTRNLGRRYQLGTRQQHLTVVLSYNRTVGHPRPHADYRKTSIKISIRTSTQYRQYRRRSRPVAAARRVPGSQDQGLFFFFFLVFFQFCDDLARFGHTLDMKIKTHHNSSIQVFFFFFSRFSHVALKVAISDQRVQPNLAIRKIKSQKI